VIRRVARIAAVFGAAVAFAAPGGAQAGRDYKLDLSSVECFEPIGIAPELREIVRRRTGTDPGLMTTVAVRLDRSALADIEATYPAPTPSRNSGFHHTGDGMIRLDVETLDGRPEHGTTSFMPKDGVMMFTLPEAAVMALKARRSRCGSRDVFDPKPFRAVHRGIRETQRAMLDKQRN